MKRRVVSLVTALALCLSLCPTWALAAEAEPDTGLCPHHTSHTAECGYTPPMPDKCSHEHDDACYAAQCIHQHAAGCYQGLDPDTSLDSDPGNDPGPDGQESLSCTHVCSVESGCIVLSCTHEHDGSCYAPGMPCTYVCSICPAEDQETDGDQALYDVMTASEQNPEELTDDWSGKEPYKISGALDMNGFSITGIGCTGMQVRSTDSVSIVGTGTIRSQYGIGIEVQSGGSLIIDGNTSNLTISGTTYGLDVAAGAKVSLSGGMFSGVVEAAIRVADGDFSRLLAPGCAYFDADGAPIPAEGLATARTIVVKACTDHSNKTYAHDPRATTHTWTCAACGTKGTEPCTFTTYDENRSSVCGLNCGNEITIEVDRNSLKGLAYNETIKPANGTVKVTLKDGTVLAQDDNYTVSYSTSGVAGNADVTVTVTVTGKTYEGTWTQSFTFTKQDLTRPILEWANTADVSVTYTGQPVKVPDVIINITPNAGLSDHLQYFYKDKASGETGYSKGLPTNVGTYDVIATLPGDLANTEDGQAASSEPLTVTILKLDPVKTPPTATKPVYNKQSQELVTAGELEPAAANDGAVILFAISVNGQYSETIPTGINANQTYKVWYKVEATDNCNEFGPEQVGGVEIQRKRSNTRVELEYTSVLFDGGKKEPKVTVYDSDDWTVLPITEYEVGYSNNQNVGRATARVTDKTGGNYEVNPYSAYFQITLRTQETLSITNKPNTVTYGDTFTLSTVGGSGNGDITWEVISGNSAEFTSTNGQVRITGHEEVIVKATKDGGTNYEDATATWTFTPAKKRVVATVTAEDKTYDGNTDAKVHAVVEQGVLLGDEITITLPKKGEFDTADAGKDKTVTVETEGATITGHNSEHYDVSYSSHTVKADINKAIARITTKPARLDRTYDGTEQNLVDDTVVVVDPSDVKLEYALSKEGPYSTEIPKGINAGDYTVWYRVEETPNYTGLEPKSVNVTIGRKQVTPTITLSGDGLQKDTTTTPITYYYTYDGSAKTPEVTLYEDDGTLIPASNYTVKYSNNVNVGDAKVTVTANTDGNYEFTPDNSVDVPFKIEKEQAQVTSAPKPAGDPLTYNTRAQELVTAGAGTGGTMVYKVEDPNDPDAEFSPDIPTGINAGEYTVHYKIEGDKNHSDSDVGTVKVTIAPKRVKDPTIELKDVDGNPLVSYTYDGSAKKPAVVVKDGATVIDRDEYNIVYSNNTDAGEARVNITAKPDHNYDVTGSETFVILKADIKDPEPTAADITYNGKAQELLNAGTTKGGTVLYALGSSTSTYTDAIPTGIEARAYDVYYKVVGDKNHNDFPITEVPVTIERKPLTTITIELTPDVFEYDGQLKMPEIAVWDGKTKLPEEEYDWVCTPSDPVNSDPINEDTYTITISDNGVGNYDLTGVTANTATFTIGKTAQAELVIDHSSVATTNYGDTFTLTTSGGSGNGAVTWRATGPATVDPATNEVTITDVGEVTITAEKAADTNYRPATAQWTFTAAKRPVTAVVTVGSKYYDGTTGATVTAASIDTLGNDTVTIVPASIKANFDTPDVGEGKTVTLDTSNVQVTGDVAKYDITYPETVTADIEKATATISKLPEKIDPLTYNREAQELVTAGESNVGFIVYSLDGTNFSPEIPTGTDAGKYTAYYKVDETANYAGDAGGSIPVTIAPKSITPKIVLSATSYVYDGSKKEPLITVKDKDEKVVIDEDQYTFAWTGDGSQTEEEMLTAAGTYTVTITSKTEGNYSFEGTAKVQITPAEQDAISITGQPEHVCYGDRITTLRVTGGSGNGTVEWSIAPETTGIAINSKTGEITIQNTGTFTVTAERSVPNHKTVTDTCTFTVEPKPVAAVATVDAKEYDGKTTVDSGRIKAEVKETDLVVPGDRFTITGLTGTYDDANAGTNKSVTLNASNATGWDKDKYAVSFPKTATADINPKEVTVTVTLSGNDLQKDADGWFYIYDGTEKKPTVTVAVDSVALPASEYTFSYSNNKNVSTDGNPATVTVTSTGTGNYTFEAEPVPFTIRSASAQLKRSPGAKDLTYTGQEQELVTVGEAEGGHIEYSVDDITYSKDIPKEDEAGTYTVYYKVVPDSNHQGEAPSGSVSVTIKPKEIVDPIVTVDESVPYIYNGGSPITPDKEKIEVKDGTKVILNTEYDVSYRDNINAGTAKVVITNANGGNYIVNGTGTFTIEKDTASVAVGGAPEGKENLPYNGTEQELVTAGTADKGTMVYSLSKEGPYSPAIPTAKEVGEYVVWYKAQGDSNYNDSAASRVESSVFIIVNKVTAPNIQIAPESVTYNGKKQEPTVTVRDDAGLLIDGSEYTVTYTDSSNNDNQDLTKAGTYTVTIYADNSKYKIDDSTQTFTILPADQTPLLITDTRTDVRYGDKIQLNTTGGNGKVEWSVESSVEGANVAKISKTGLLEITGVGSGTVTATSKADGYTDQTATWTFYANAKEVTAVLTGVSRPYADNDLSVTVKAAVPAGELVPNDTITIEDLRGTFSDPNVGTDKKVTVDSSNPKVTGNDSGHYAIIIPPTTTASITKANVTDITPPTPADDLTYDGTAQKLVQPGSVTGGIGTMEYSLDNSTYSTNLPTGADAKGYDVWYRVKGDSNHKDVEAVKLTETEKITIAPQVVDEPTIEFTPSGASYDGNVHKPAVTVKDKNGREIPSSEYEVAYSTATDWTKAGDHEVTITDKTGGNYDITKKDAPFTITPMGQSPLSIVNQPSKVQYGDTFTLVATGGTGTGTVSWQSDKESIAAVDQYGVVTVRGVGGPVKITVTKTADGNYGESTASWTFNAAKKPVTPIVTAKDKVYNGKDEAELVITWKPGDLVDNDTIDLKSVLTGRFEDPSVGTNKRVDIGGTISNEKYDVLIPRTTTASITKKPADDITLDGLELIYTGSPQELVKISGNAVGKPILFSLNGLSFISTIPEATDAEKYTVWYKVEGSATQEESGMKSFVTTIKPKTVTEANLKIELSPEEFDYDGTAKKPDVTVKDGNTVIPASEYTVSYSNNTAVGTSATVTVTDNAKGNYEFAEQKVNFTIKAGALKYTVEPEAKSLTYNGFDQALVTTGTAKNGTVVYSLMQNGEYTSTPSRGKNAGTYQVWYKIKSDNGVDYTEARDVIVVIEPKTVTPRITLDLASNSVPYDGSAWRPEVKSVSVGNDVIDSNDYLVTYSNNINPGTATVTVQSTGGNYQFYASTTFEIVKAKAEFTEEPKPRTGLVYTGKPQALIDENTGISTQGIVFYSLNARDFSTDIPTGTAVRKYTIYAKIQGNATHADSDIMVIPGAEITKNTIADDNLEVSFEGNNIFSYTGQPVKPAVIVTDGNGNTIDANEYSLTYANNTNVSTAGNKASVTVKCKGINYEFNDKTIDFTIIGAGQTPLEITGKKDTVYYGDVLSLGTTGGTGTGNVTWEVTTGRDIVNANSGQFEITGTGNIKITATKTASTGYDAMTAEWSFYAQPKPINVTVTAANRPFDGGNSATLTATVRSSDLVSGDTVKLTATGHFEDGEVGTNKRVIIDSVAIDTANSSTDAGTKYKLICPDETTASITIATAEVDIPPEPVDGLTYTGKPLALVKPGTATNGDMHYSLDGVNYDARIPTATDVGTYTVYFKAHGEGNYKDSLRDTREVTISPNTKTPTIWLDPAVVQYDTTPKTPTVKLLDDANREIPKEDYVVTLAPGAPWTAVGDYTVTVKDIPGGNYEFTDPEPATFRIVRASQNPLSITNLPGEVHYGDTFRLSASGGSGTGEIVWESSKDTIATVDTSGQVKVIGTGAFTITAYRDTDGSYSESNKVRQPFSAEPKRITPVVTAEDKPYDGNDTATVTATFKSGDLVKAGEVTLTVINGKFASADVGTNKKVTFTGSAGGTGTTNYEIEWPESTTASIYKVDAKLENAPTPNNRAYDGSAEPLVFAGSTFGNIGIIKYSLSQNGVYSKEIPEATEAGEYEVWFKVEETINYTGIAAAMVPVKISEASTQPTPSPTPSAAPALRAPNRVSTSAPMQTSVQDGTATTIVSASAASELVKEAAANDSQSVVIKPEITDSVTRSEVSIPASAVSQIENETDADLMVSTPVADVTIPNGALSTLSSAGGTVDIVTEQVEQAVVLTVTADGETVESIPGGVTLTVPVEDAGPGTVAVLVHEDGTRETIRKSVTEDGTVRIPLDGSATVEIVDNSKSFDDVPDTSWAADAVAFASARELFNGTSETAFSPDEPMSRAMLATVLYNLEGQPDQSLTSEFSDVSSDAWYASGVSWAAEKGITNGYGDGQFGPDDDVTREQFAVMLWKYAGSPKVSGEDLDFTDADQISEYALKALRWAAANGILSGHGDGRLDPSGLTTRAQAAQMLKNFLENI